MAHETSRRLLKKARMNRRRWDDPEVVDAMLIDMTRRAGGGAAKLKRTPEEVEKVLAFLADCPHIRDSPLQKETLLVKGADGKKNVKVPRLYCEVSFVKLHQLCQQEKGIAFEFDTFRKVLPPNLWRLTARREACGCSTCINMHRMHRTLCGFRSRLKAKLRGQARAKYTPPEHASPSLALGAFNPCKEVAGVGFRPAKCWMQHGTCGCGGVVKRYKIPAEERKVGASAPKISYAMWKTKDKRTQLIKETRLIGEFMKARRLPPSVPPPCSM